MVSAPFRFAYHSVFGKKTQRTGPNPKKVSASETCFGTKKNPPMVDQTIGGFFYIRRGENEKVACFMVLGYNRVFKNLRG